MAVPRQEFLDFQQLVNPTGGTLRDAIWDHFFPENVNTRDPVVYEYKVSSSVRFLVLIFEFLGLSTDFGLAFVFL